MAKKSTRERVSGRYFTWLLFTRDGVWYADGRTNTPSAGRHSLGTSDRTTAFEVVHQLDVARAVDLGLADKAERNTRPTPGLDLDQGQELYLRHVARPRIAGGARPKSVARYKAVFDKFIPFARREGVQTWDRVTTAVLENYASWLDGEGYAYRTEYLELTTMKQCVNWLRKAEYLANGPMVALSLRKPTGTDTYCWRPGEVAAIVAHCKADSALNWLANVVTALATTGLRISELASLRVSDVDGDANMIRLTDETSRATSRGGANRRQTKNGRSRSFPINAALKPVLARLPDSADGLLFHGPRGGRLKPDTVRNVLIRDVLTPLSKQFPSTGAIGFRDGRLHSFRHYFCSQCAAGGVSELTVMNWLGHQASGMVKHYFHLHDEQAQEQMARVQFVPNVSGTLPPTDLKGNRGSGAGDRTGET